MLQSMQKKTKNVNFAMMSSTVSEILKLAGGAPTEQVNVARALKEPANDEKTSRIDSVCTGTRGDGHGDVLQDRVKQISNRIFIQIGKNIYLC